MKLKACSTILLLMIASCSVANEFIIDSQTKFNAISRAKLSPGDAVLLKRGMSFSGMLAPSGNGTEAAPIRIGAYGDGARPGIHAEGKNIAGILLKNLSFWEIGGVEVTNTDGSEKNQGMLYGIYVVAEGVEGTYRHIYLDDCHIHDVNGKVAGKKRGGIHVHVKDLEATTFHDLRITNNRIVNVGGVGIGNYSPCGKVEFLENGTRNHYLWTQVYEEYIVAFSTPGRLTDRGNERTLI